MPHFHSHEDGGHRQPRDPEKTHAYLVGGGIASLAAAAYLIHDAGIPPAQIHILESSPLAGGSMDGAGDPDTGYVMRGGRMLNFTYRCLYDLLGTIPSLTDSDISVMDEIKRFNSVKGHKTHSLARIVVDSANEDKFPDFANVDDFGLSWKDRRTLIEMTIESEDKLGSKTIAECFSEDFLKTNFWYMWASMCVLRDHVLFKSTTNDSKLGSLSNHGTVQSNSGDTSIDSFTSYQGWARWKEWIVRLTTNTTPLFYQWPRILFNKA